MVNSPYQPMPNRYGGPPPFAPPMPAHAPLRDGCAPALNASYRRLLFRSAALPAVGFASDVVMAAVVPDALRTRIVGHLTLGLLLMTLQVTVIITALMVHGRRLGRHDLVVESLRRQTAEHTHRRPA